MMTKPCGNWPKLHKVRSGMRITGKGRNKSFLIAKAGGGTIAQLEALFPEGHPYRHSTIGSMADLDAASLDDVVAFHDRWQSGQLLSRMMQDIGMLRRWMAFGLVLLVVNVLTIFIGTLLLNLLF